MKQGISVQRVRLVIELTLKSIENITQESVKNYLVELSQGLTMTIVMDPICHAWAKDYNPKKYSGFEAWVVWAESGTQLYYWEDEKFLTIDIYTCKNFNPDKALEITKKYFNVDQIAHQLVPHVLEENSNNTKKAAIANTSNGRGVVATSPILEGEAVAVFDGEVYFAESESMLPDISRNHACPFHKYWYRDGKPNSFSRHINHSCDPNCGIKNLFQVVAMRTIEQGEEITIDYGMICNSDWENPEGKCLCGSPKCRGKILPYRELPQRVKDSYRGYVSTWLQR